jgi:phosphoglycolate phosphatase-like HAD superfamily hydrolase
MKFRLLPMALLALGLQVPAGAAEPATELRHWPPAQAQALEQAIAKAPPGAYAVFDADNTLWRNDLEESLLAYMEMRGLLSPKTLPAALRPLPLAPGESLYGYYQRLCDVDDELCYPWIAQVFAGFSLDRLKGLVDDLLAYDKSIPVRYRAGGKTVSDFVRSPRPYPGQTELVHRLMDAGIKVYVVTAASEDLSRMVASDPKYGLGVKPENVVGVILWLRDPKTGQLTTTRREIRRTGGFPVSPRDLARRGAMVTTSYLAEPASWYVGKMAAIQSTIDPVRRPFLVAGDSPSDWWMLFYADGGRGGVRVWIDRKIGYTEKLAQARRARAAAETEAGLPAQADSNWVIVTQADIGG